MDFIFDRTRRFNFYTIQTFHAAQVFEMYLNFRGSVEYESGN